MLRHSLPAVTAVLCLLLASDAQAGGLIRRLPEVGEYARFAYRVTPYSGTLPEEGEMVLNCVGSAEIEGLRYLWIEIDETSETYDLDGQPLSTRNHITKLLVAEDTLLSHDGEIARGWVKFDNRESPDEVRGGLASELAPGAFYVAVREDVRNTLLGIEDEEAIEAPTEISMDGETRTLTSAVSGRTSSLTIEPNTQGIIMRRQADRTSIWWLEADLAFGVAAWESTMKGASGVAGDMGPPRIKEYTQRYDLVEFGTGAVSGLPDHN